MGNDQQNKQGGTKMKEEKMGNAFIENCKSMVNNEEETEEEEVSTDEDKLNRIREILEE